MYSFLFYEGVFIHIHHGINNKLMQDNGLLFKNLL